MSLIFMSSAGTRPSSPFSVSAVVQSYNMDGTLGAWGGSQNPASLFHADKTPALPLTLEQGDTWRVKPGSISPVGATITELPGGNYTVSGPADTYTFTVEIHDQSTWATHEVSRSIVVS